MMFCLRNILFWMFVLVTSRYRITCITLQDVFCYTFQIKIAIEPGAFHYSWITFHFKEFQSVAIEENFELFFYLPHMR